MHFSLPPAGVLVTIASGLAILSRPESALWGLLSPADEPLQSEAARDAERSLCRTAGWELSCRVAGGFTGALARRRAGGVGLSVTLRLERDERYCLPRGRARLLRPSRFFAPSGSWAVEELDESLVPRSLEIRLQSAGVESGGETLLAPGPIFLRAAIECDPSASRVAAMSGGAAGGDAAVRVVRGTVEMQEDIGLGFSEYRLVGTFEARPSLRELKTAARENEEGGT